MGKRHESIGIKQVVRLEWYDLTLDLLLHKESAKNIRQELTTLLRDRLQTGGFGERGVDTYGKAVTQLMQCWVTPDKDLLGLRDTALQLAEHCPRNERLPLHWAMTIAAYPFWQKVAALTGRLLNLQAQVTQAQIRARCYETFGERSTIERSARRVIRSLVSWGVLLDTPEGNAKGCYGKSAPMIIANSTTALLLIEASLHASGSDTLSLNAIKNDPALFPFVLPELNGSIQSSKNIEYIRHGLDHEMLRLASLS